MNNANTKGLESFVSTFNVRTPVNPSILQALFVLNMSPLLNIEVVSNETNTDVRMYNLFIR